MLSTKLSRAATCAAAASTSSAAPSSNAVHRATACLATRSRPSHQRRPSSSKASCPPDSASSNSKPAPTTKAAGVVEDKPSLSHPAPQPRSSKRTNRTRRPKTTATSGDKLEDHFAGLPAVPGTQHLSQSDLSVSSFFSLHRPISLKHTIPPICSVETFNTIFEPQKQVDAWANGNSAEGRPEDVVYALGSLFQNLDHGTRESQDDGMRWEVLQESSSNHDGIRHLDGPPRQKTMDELVAEFRPFNAPPPPEPFRGEHKFGPKRKASRTKSQSYGATIIVTETVENDGSKSYTASSSPIVRIPGPNDVPVLEDPFCEENQSRFPHRERRLERSRAFWLHQKEKMQEMPLQKQKMFLISVKRQRKLKMKKHKYKKLMKRTRNLRRRQDRA